MDSHTHSARGKRITFFIVATLAFSAFALALSVKPASAQGIPAVCQQYPDLPQCQGPTGTTGPTGPTSPTGPTGTVPTDVAGPTGDISGKGELPFTGYPLTALILLLLVLLLAGLAIRTYLAVRDRVGGDRGIEP